MTPCLRSRRRAAALSSSAGRIPSHRGDPWPGPESGSPRDPAPPPDPAGNTPGGLLPATHVVMAAARWSDPAAKDEKTWASACPILPLRSIAVTTIWADLRASVECRPWFYVRQAPRSLSRIELAAPRTHAVPSPQLMPLAVTTHCSCHQAALRIINIAGRGQRQEVVGLTFECPA